MPHQNPAPGNDPGLTKHMLLIGDACALTKDEWSKQAIEWVDFMERANQQLESIFRANSNRVPDENSPHFEIWESLSHYVEILDAWLSKIAASGIVPLKRREKVIRSKVARKQSAKAPAAHGEGKLQ